MTLRRLSAALVVVSGLFLLGLAHTGARQAEAQPTHPAYSADTDEESRGNYDTATQRFRENQPRHWRQMVTNR